MSAIDYSEWRFCDESDGWAKTFYCLRIGSHEYVAGLCDDCGCELLEADHDPDYDGEERGFVDSITYQCVACGSANSYGWTTSVDELRAAIARTLFPEPHHSIDPIAIAAQVRP